MKKLRVVFGLTAAAAIFTGGYVAGQAKNQYGTPTSIVHVSLIKWKDGIADAEKKKAIDGVKAMAAEIKGIKNIWLHPSRMQPRDYHDAFVIEFEDRAAVERYATDPVHEKWAEHFNSIRAASISPQITNCPPAGCS